MAYTDIAWRTFRPAEGFYTSEVQSPRRLPIRTFLPTGYEPNYAYPLVVFFHGHGGNEEQVLHLAPRLSRRNYICIGLRGHHALGERADGKPALSWGTDGTHDSQVEDYVLGAIEQTRRNYHVHSERIHLAGICEGAMPAYRLSLTYPDRFGGMIALNGSLPPSGSLYLRLPEVRQLRVFIGHGIANAIIPFGSARANFRLLYTAGLDVTMKSYATTHRLHPDMLRDIDRWIMTQCN
jgi:phospholipase/carboxylesterase